MLGFCNHKWDTTGEKFNLPREDHIAKFDTATERKLLFGFTIITQECTSCTKTRAYTVLGETENAIIATQKA